MGTMGKELPRCVILGGGREIGGAAHVWRLDRPMGLGELSHQPDWQGPFDRSNFRRSVLARLDLWQRAARSALSRRLAAGRRHELADLFPRRHQNGQPVAEVRHALAEDPYLCRLSADRRLHLAFGFLSAGYRLRMGAVGGL